MVASERGTRQLLKIIETFRDVDATMPIQALAAFLYIATHEGENISTVATKINMAQSAASRNISSLTDWDWRKKPGLKLVEYRQDPMNLSQKTLYLTAKGKRLLDRVLEIIEET